MVLSVKIILVLSLFFIFLQDLKERRVYGLLIIISGLLLSYLHYRGSTPQLFLASITLNFFVIIMLYGCLYVYAKLKLKVSLNTAFGLGDLLFFIALSMGFSTVSFLILFVSSLLFTLFTSLLLKVKYSLPTIPLAGFQAFFIAFIMMINWFFNLTDLYSL